VIEGHHNAPDHHERNFPARLGPVKTICRPGLLLRRFTLCRSNQIPGAMAMTHATETVNGPARPTLVMAMDLGRGQWRLGFAIGAGQRPRSRTIRGDEWRRLGDEIAAAKAKFHLPFDARVVSCYEAGPDGFWIHRYLTTLGVESLVIDPASIEVNRRGSE